jgi:hypothetical protein
MKKTIKERNRAFELLEKGKWKQAWRILGEDIPHESLRACGHYCLQVGRLGSAIRLLDVFGDRNDLFACLEACKKENLVKASQYVSHMLGVPFEQSGHYPNNANVKQLSIGGVPLSQDVTE